MQKSFRKKKLRSITKKNISMKKKLGIIVYIDYLIKIKDYTQDSATKIPLCFNDISYISTDSYKDSNQKIVHVRNNYVHVKSICGKNYFYKSSLKHLLEILPNNFIRINESSIVHISTNSFQGIINGSKIIINNTLFHIKATYSKNVKSKLNELYII